MKLISMTDFVSNYTETGCLLKEINKIRNYANFLKQPLKLEMFFPCDDNGSVLEHPIYTTNHSDECYCKGCEEETKRCSDLQDQYQKAKEKVLFEGFHLLSFNPVDKSYYLANTDKRITVWIEPNDNIEDMIEYNLQLTQNAIKQLGL